MRAATSSGLGVGRGVRSEPVDLDAVFGFRLLILVELVPPAVARRVDAARLEREVVGVGGLGERLFERDEPFAPELHERLVEGLHAVRAVTLPDDVAQLARAVGLLDALL